MPPPSLRYGIWSFIFCKCWFDGIEEDQGYYRTASESDMGVFLSDSLICAHYAYTVAE